MSSAPAAQVAPRGYRRRSRWRHFTIQNARLQPILVTLATLAIYQGAAIKILPQPGGKIPEGYTNALANPNAPTALIYLALVLGLWFVFRRTSFGVSVYA